jgi:hypothetical protein
VRQVRGHPMSVSLFPAGEPLRISISATWINSRVGALIGVYEDEDRIQGIVVCEDGSMALVPFSDFTVDWRYDVETDRWVDVNTRQTDQEV